MQTYSLSFKLISAKLTATERFIIARYTETSSDNELSTTLSSDAFRNYLASEGQECHEVAEWMLRTPLQDVHAHIARFMEAMMWEAEAQKQEMSYRDHIGSL